MKRVINKTFIFILIIIILIQANLVYSVSVSAPTVNSTNRWKNFSINIYGERDHLTKNNSSASAKLRSKIPANLVHTQFFDISSNGKTIYTTLSNLDPSTKGVLLVDKVKGTTIKTMQLNHFGHGQGFAVDSKGYMYVSSLFNADSRSLGVSYFPFSAGKVKNYYAGKTYIFSLKDLKEADYQKLTVSQLHLELRPILDEEHGYFAVRVIYGTDKRKIFIYKLSEVKKLKEHSAKITDFTVNNKKKAISLDVCNLKELKPVIIVDVAKFDAGPVIQGVDIYGDKIYIYKGEHAFYIPSGKTAPEGDLKNYNLASIAVINWKGEILQTNFSAKENVEYNLRSYMYKNNSTLMKTIFNPKGSNRTSENYGYDYKEAEGIQVKDGKIYIGITTRAKGLEYKNFDIRVLK